MNNLLLRTAVLRCNQRCSPSQFYVPQKLLYRSVRAVNAMNFTPVDNKSIRKHWLAERVFATGMVGLYPLAFLYQPYWMNYALTVAVVLHSYWGISGVTKDYIHGKSAPAISRYVVKVVFALTLAILFYFNYHDVGVINAIKMVWSI